MASPVSLPLSPAFGSNANPLVGALMDVFVTGTTTPATAYQNAARTTPHANPIVASADGKFPQIFLAANVVYRFRVRDSAGTPVPGYDFDPISEAASLATLLSTAGAASVVTATGTTVQDEVNQITNGNRGPSISFSFTWGAVNGYAVTRQNSAFTVNPAATSNPIFGKASDYSSNVGKATNVPYQVGEFLALKMTAGAGNGYARNDVFEMNSGVSSTIAGTTYEMNLNSWDHHSGDTTGEYDIMNPAQIGWVTMQNLVAGGNKRALSALWVGIPSGASKLYNRILAFNDCCALHVIEGKHTGTSLIRMAVGSSTSGATLDLSEVSADVSYFMANGASLAGYNAARSSVLRFAKIDGGDNLALGQNTAGISVAGAALFPSTDNAVDLGKTGTNRFKTIYLANSPSVTSDPKLKENLTPADADKIVAFGDHPEFLTKTWTWKVGGMEPYEIEVDGMVPVDGETEEVPLFNEDGSPKLWQRTDPKTGKALINPETGAEYDAEPATERRQKLQPGKVKEIAYRPVPGKRTHIGYDAAAINAICHELGVDWGLVVRDAEGILHLRMEPFIAIVSAYARIKMQRLEDRLARLEAA